VSVMATEAYYSVYSGNVLTVFLTSQQALMPDILHWLGITKIDRMYVSILFLSTKKSVANSVLL
jgi:hypothetical protein